MRLVPVFTLETNNQAKNECLPKFVQTNNASSSIKTANIELLKAGCTYIHHFWVKLSLEDDSYRKAPSMYIHMLKR